MKISILHATRRDSICHVILSWLGNASMTIPIEYILSIDADDIGNYDFSGSFEYDEFKIITNDNRSAIDAFNRAAEEANGGIFVCISDDMRCFENWDLALIKAIGDKKDFYMKVSDGLQPTLVTMPIFDRAYYERLGYVWNPAYKHMFCDQEATAVAIMLGRYVQANLLFPHVHYTTGITLKDAVNERNDATWDQGAQLFHNNMKTNFGIINPVIPYSAIKWR